MYRGCRNSLRFCRKKLFLPNIWIREFEVILVVTCWQNADRFYSLYLENHYKLKPSLLMPIEDIYCLFIHVNKHFLRSFIQPVTIRNADFVTCCGILYKDHITWIRPQKLGSSLDRCGHKRFPRLSVKYIRIIIHNIE